MCDFNADSPMFEMAIIRWQHLHKALFSSIQGLFHKIQALLLQIQGVFKEFSRT